jgi:hypothetical protein
MRKIFLMVSMGCAACAGAPAAPNPTPVGSPSASTPTAAPSASASPGASATSGATATATASATSSTPEAPDAGASASSTEGSEWMDHCQDVGKEFEKLVRPALKKCHADASKKEYQRGKVKITFKIDWDGAKKDVRTSEKPTLPDPIVRCMLKAVKDAKFTDPEQCKGKDVTLIEQFPP